MNKKRGSSQSKLSISRRYLNSKRHTIGYTVGGKRMSVAETTRLARQGRIKNARVVGKHVQSAAGCSPLSSLPQVIDRA